jgi:hypothetical protein
MQAVEKLLSLGFGRSSTALCGDLIEYCSEDERRNTEFLAATSAVEFHRNGVQFGRRSQISLASDGHAS